MKLKNIAVPLLVVLVIACIVYWSTRNPLNHPTKYGSADVSNDIIVTLQKVDSYFCSLWKEANLTLSQRSDDLLVLRRLSVSLLGTIPSLEEI